MMDQVEFREQKIHEAFKMANQPLLKSFNQPKTPEWLTQEGKSDQIKPCWRSMQIMELRQRIRSSSETHSCEPASAWSSQLRPKQHSLENMTLKIRTNDASAYAHWNTAYKQSEEQNRRSMPSVPEREWPDSKKIIIKNKIHWFWIVLWYAVDWNIY